MWVETVELTSYGAIQGESIVFSEDKINLVVEPNEYGKTTLATAIWSILFDFAHDQKAEDDRLTARDARKPKSGLPYSAKMDVNHKHKRLTIIRNFAEGTYQVLDRDHREDVTSQYQGANGEDEIGLRLTGMTRELFKSTCFVGQRELDEHAFGGESSLASLVQGIADSASPSGTCAQAVRVLNESLENTTIKDRSVKMDNLIRDLEIVRQDLLTKIKAYERDRRDVSASFDRLMIINRILSGDNNRYKATEYHNLKFQLSDAESRLARLREIRSRRDQLTGDIDDLPPVQEIAPDIRRPLMDLWNRRQVKADELSRLRAELSPQETNFKEKQKELKARLGNLSVFTAEEAHMVSSLAGSMQTAEEELTTLSERRSNEREKFTRDTGARDLEEVRKSITSLESEGVDNARGYNSLIVAFQEQLQDAERNLHQSRAKQKELAGKREEIRKKRQLVSIIVGFAGVMVAVAGIAIFVVAKALAYWTIPLVVAGAIALIISAILITPVFKPQTILKAEFAATDADVNRIVNDMQDKQNKVGALEIKLDTLARKVGLSNRKELTGKLEEYGQQSAKLKELTLLEQLVDQKEQVVKRYRADLTRFLEKAERTEVEPSAKSARDLANSLSQYIEEARQLTDVHHEAASNTRKFSQIEDDVMDTDRAILNLFRKAGTDLGDDEESALEEARARLNNIHALTRMQSELESLESETGSNWSELAGQIKNVQDYQARVIQQLESLKQLYPGIEELTPLTEEELAAEEEAPKDMRELEGLKQEREEALIRIRTLSTTCDEHYLLAMEDLDLTEFKLQSAKRARLALELARDTLKRLSGENYMDWSHHLNNIATEMLARLGMGYDEVKFDNELKLVARRQSDGDQISAAQIMSQLSTGTKEQLHWLARMVVARYLSRSNTLPIIMDEPFSESDDDRFVKMMRFLTTVIAQEHQVILFSCHQQRHLWLKQQLDESEKNKLIFCRRQKA